MTGIYIIKNKTNNKVYIGQALNIKNRWKKHINILSKNKYIDKKQKPTHLQAAWNKDGEENFTFDILEECSKEELDDKEKYWIAYYKSNNRDYGYNKTDGGSNGMPTEESRIKMSEAAVGKPKSEEHKQNMRKPKSEEHRRNIGKGKQGIPISEEAKQKISNANKGKESAFKGKKHTEESLQKMSDALKGKDTWMKGKHHTEESRRKISENNGRGWLGKNLPEEMKKKISDSHKGEKNPMYGKKPANYIEITQEMLDDYNNGIKRNDFCIKYNVSMAIWRNVRKLFMAK